MCEYKVDGELHCSICGQLIPGGEWFYEVDGKAYCEDCMDDCKHTAPYRGEGSY